MTFNETYIAFDESIAALEAEIEEIAEQLAELVEGNPLIPQLKAKRTRLATQRKGAVWARDQAHESDDFPMWDEDIDGVTLAAVRAGTLDGIKSEVADREGGGSDLLLIADGTVEAPYVDPDHSEEQRAGVVGQLHPYYQDWAAARIDELMDPEGNATGSSNSLRET